MINKQDSIPQLRAKNRLFPRVCLWIGLGVILICICLVGMFWMGDSMISHEIKNHLNNPESIKNMEDLQTRLLIFTVVGISLSLVIGLMLEIRIWLQTRQEIGLKEVNEQLAASNQQLEASEQQLRAANQQLQASEQQLRAANQQLIASEQKVLEERDRAQCYFDLAGTMLLVLGPDGRIHQINQKGCQILEADESSIVGKDWCSTFLPERYRESVRGVFEQIAEGHVESFSHNENPVLTAKGDEKLIAWYNTILRDEDGQFMAILSSGEDITEKRKAEQKIREADERLRVLFDKAPDAIYVCDAKGRLIEVNDYACQATGHTREELLSLRGFDIDCNNQEGFQAFNEQLKSGFPETVETLHRKKNGQTFPVEITVALLQTEEGPHFIAIARDITKRKHAEEAIEKRIIALTQPLDDTQDILFESLFNLRDLQCLQDEFCQATGVASIITQPDGTPITEPSNFCRLCKDVIRKTKKGLENCFKSDAYLGRYNADGPIIHPCLSGGLWDAGAAITVGGQHIASWLIGQVRDETQCEEKISQYAHEIGADEEEMIRAFCEVPAMSREQFGKVAQALYTLANQLSTSAYQNVQQARFITERQQAEKKVLQYQEQLRALVSQLTLSEEKERKRLAVELHDGICQTLAMTKLSVDEQLALQSAQSANEIKELLENLDEQLTNLIDDTRSLTNNLGTPMLQTMGLQAAIEKWLETEVTAKHGIETHVHNKGIPKTLHEDTKTLLFRAVREMATNVVKYANSKTFSIELGIEDGQLILVARDEGDGFCSSNLMETDFSQGGYGLFSINERITYIGGSMQIDSAPGQGTRICLKVPITCEIEAEGNSDWEPQI